MVAFWLASPFCVVPESSYIFLQCSLLVFELLNCSQQHQVNSGFIQNSHIRRGSRKIWRLFSSIDPYALIQITPTHRQTFAVMVVQTNKLDGNDTTLSHHPYIFCHFANYAPHIPQRSSTGHALHSSCIQARQTLSAMLSVATTPQHNSLPMHINMHYTPTTTHPLPSTTFHNPPLHTTNKHKAYLPRVRMCEGVKQVVLSICLSVHQSVCHSVW